MAAKKKSKTRNQTDMLGNGDNSRLASLDGLLNKYCDLQTDEEALILKWIQPIRDKKNKVKAEAKADFDVPTKAFNARANLLLIERLDDSDELVLSVNELFQATPVGKNVDLIELAARVKVKKEEKAKAKDKAKVTESDI